MDSRRQLIKQGRIKRKTISCYKMPKTLSLFRAYHWQGMDCSMNFLMLTGTICVWLTLPFSANMAT